MPKEAPIGYATSYQKIPNLVNRLQAKVELQALELKVLKALQKIDTLKYDNDSLAVLNNTDWRTERSDSLA